MAVSKAWVGALVTDVKIGLLFSTRLPLSHAVEVSGRDVAQASWAMPVAGAVVGLIGAVIYWLAHMVGLPPLPAATLAVAATLGTTGCLHEDGLADTADGFGGGGTRERKLEIMRDSRIGAYGACALITSLLLRASAVASLAEPAAAALALIAAHVVARAAMPIFMHLTPRARSDGLSADAGRPSGRNAATAGLFGAAAAILCLGPVTGCAALVLTALATGIMAWLCRSQIGGQTGDVVGAVEQVNEVVV